jgi:acetoin utilization deacetylase AcuC-like enzyme
VTIITDERCTGYAQPGHPERPQRVATTLKKLRDQAELPLAFAAPEAVSDEMILRAHAPTMLARLRLAKDFDEDTPFFPNIADHARRSVGGALAALQCARAGEPAFSLMRPPGHHAMHNYSMGFCYLNNIAIATLAALHDGVKRVAVFDFDVHHGNGTEDILRGVPSAAFFSVHQHPAYPGTGARNVGNNCFNYPVAPHTPRAEYRAALARALADLKQFAPELVAVSAGFDAFARDLLAQGSLEAEDFHWLGAELLALDVPLFSALEGGYSSKLPELIFAYLKGLAGK